MVDITGVEINLSKKEEGNAQFGVMDIFCEISRIIGHSGTFVLLHKNGLSLKMVIQQKIRCYFWRKTT